MMAAGKGIAIVGGSGDVAPASRKKKADKAVWVPTRMTWPGRCTLAAEAAVPTTYTRDKGEVVPVKAVSVKAVLSSLAGWDEEGQSESNYPSNALIAFRTGLGLRTVNSAVRVLTEAGWLRKTRRGNLTNSKLCRLDWNRIEAARAKFVPPKKTWDGNPAVPPASPPPVIQTGPVGYFEGRAPAAIADELTKMTLNWNGIADEALHHGGVVPEEVLRPVISQLVREVDGEVLWEAIAQIKPPAWKLIADAPDPGRDLRSALDNALANPESQDEDEGEPDWEEAEAEEG